jgi:hypothetical protein
VEIRLLLPQHRSLSQVMMGILPVALFSNGHTFYVQHLQDRLDEGLEPYAVHATFQYGAAPGVRFGLGKAAAGRITAEKGGKCVINASLLR